MGVFRKAAAGAAIAAGAWALAIGAVGILSEEASGQGTNSFYNFIFGAPLATTPAGVTDYIPVTQGGVIKHLRASGVALSGPFFNPVADHNADSTGVSDAATAIGQSVADCNAAGGGVIDVPEGTYKLTSSITFVTTSGCRFYFHNVTLAPSGTASLNAITFSGTGVGSALTLNANALQDTKSFQTTTNTGLAVGGFVYFERDAPNNGGAASLYQFISKIVSISGSGPYTININNSFPVAFSTAASGLLVAPWTPLQNVGIDGNLLIDATAHTVGDISGVVVADVAFGSFRHIRGLNTNPGRTFLSSKGYANVFDDISSDNGSDPANAAIWFTGETLPNVSNVAARGGVGSGFGAQIQGSSYPVVVNMMSTGHGHTVGRNIKVQATNNGRFTNLVGNAGAANGIGIAVGSTRNVFHGWSANNNANSEGLWLSDQYNIDNQFFGGSAHGNTTRDVYIGTTDTGNAFYGLDADVIVNNGNALIVRQVGGALQVTGGISGTTTVTTGNVAFGTGLYSAARMSSRCVDQTSSNYAAYLDDSAASVVSYARCDGLVYARSFFSDGLAVFTNATASTSLTTGAVVVTGGVAIGGRLNVGGTINQFGAAAGAPAHIASGQSTAPALTSCGSSPSIVGTDTAGTITTGTTATGCIITFNVAYVSVPHCVVTWQSTPAASQSYVVAVGSITLTQTSANGRIVNYHCIGQNGG